MNQSDTKIGDWFSFNEGQGQISLIYGDTVIIDGYQLNIAELEPIPLTIEILEKNGFTIGNYNEWTNPICDFIHFSIYNYKKKEWGFYARGAMEEVCLTTIKYVHEFQHLLWALGLNDKIKVLI